MRGKCMQFPSQPLPPWVHVRTRTGLKPCHCATGGPVWPLQIRGLGLGPSGRHQPGSEGSPGRGGWEQAGTPGLQLLTLSLHGRGHSQASGPGSRPPFSSDSMLLHCCPPGGAVAGWPPRLERRAGPRGPKEGGSKNVIHPKAEKPAFCSRQPQWAQDQSQQGPLL